MWYRPTLIFGDNVYYVGKHGNDNLNGRHPNTPKLTFGAAITAAQAQSPENDNRFAIVCLDSGIYIENIICVDYVDIFAPNAKVSGQITLADYMKVTLREVEAPICFFKPTGQVEKCMIECDVIKCTQVGILHATSEGSTVLARVSQIWCNGDNSIGVGSITEDFGHIHLYAQDIYLNANNCYGVAVLGSDGFEGTVEHILEIGNRTNTTAIFLGNNAIVNINVQQIVADVSWNVSAVSAELNMFINKNTTGDGNVETGTVNVSTP